MKKIVFAILLLIPAMAAAQTAPAANSGGKFTRFARFIGRQAKETISDVRRDPLWAAAVVGTFVLEGIAEGQTAYGRNRGLNESNFFYGRHPSTARIAGEGSALTFVNLAAIHTLRELFTNSCRREAADPNSRWNSGKIDAASYNPETCKYAVDAVPIAIWAPRIQDIRGNFRVLDGANGKDGAR